MSLEKNVQKAMVSAMKEKNKIALETLRAIKSAILLAKTETGSSDTLSETDEIKLLSKMKKQRQDAAAIYREQSRSEMAEEEEAQALIIDQFLPKQLTADEIAVVIKEIISTTGASSMKEIGKVMGIANKKMVGQADGKTISTLVKQLLS